MFLEQLNTTQLLWIDNWRRGGEGAVLNSKSEYSRCRIPRLIVEEQDMEEMNKKEQEQEIEMIRKLDKNLRNMGEYI